MSDLVGNPEDRFSRVAAHLMFPVPYFVGEVPLMIFFFFLSFGWSSEPNIGLLCMFVEALHKLFHFK